MRVTVLAILAIVWTGCTAMAAAESLEKRGQAAIDGFERSLRERDAAAADAFRAGVEAETVRTQRKPRTDSRRASSAFPISCRRCVISGDAWSKRVIGAKAWRFAAERAPPKIPATRGSLWFRALATSRPGTTPRARRRTRPGALRGPRSSGGVTTLGSPSGRATVGLLTNDLKLLDAGVDRLKAVAPGDSATGVYGMILLASYGRFAEARASLEAARAAGLPEAPYSQLSRQLAAAVPWTTKIRRPALFALVAWLLGAVALIALGAFLHKATLRSAETMPPTPEGSEQGASCAELIGESLPRVVRTTSCRSRSSS